ncbi:TonB-dependent receptor [uncultured Massilia sp.]|uniref:TonB-dependent receptor n=1 Tax=uncultured Massilia sp. TaxID=169973 RepID=UPI0025EFC93F|nr:TonB-dependent receptor [uncultured Massilia sp.]
MKQFQKTAIAVAAAQIALLAANAASAQTDAQAQAPQAGNVVVVTGQRAALNSAQKLKQNSDEIVDSIVAEDIGKLPDRSVTEVLQRVVGVTIDRTMAKGDPEHYSVEGSGVTIRGLTYTRSELNGRDSFSANGGRSLNFEDVPPELMAGVDIYKNPSAEQIEGAIGGLVNLRTAMPFDFKGRKVAASLSNTYSELKKGKWSPSGSVMVSDRWKTGFGEVGALVDLAYSESGTRTDAFQVEPYYPRNDVQPGKTVWVPKGSQWRTLEFNRKREGAYAALQWKKDATLSSSLTYFKSKYEMQWDEQAIFSAASPYNITVDPGATYDARGALLSGVLRDTVDGGIDFGADTRSANRKSDTTDISWHTTWRPNSAWTFDADVQRIKAKSHSFDSTVATAIKMQQENLDLRGGVPTLTFSDADRAYLANPNNYYWAFTQEHLDRSEADEWALKLDAKYAFDHPVLRDVRFGVRFTDRDAVTQNSNPSYNWGAVTQPWQGELVDANGVKHLAYLGDPRFGGQTQVHDFNNFFNNNTSVPSLVFPNVALATGYPGSYATLHGYYDVLCKEVAASKGVPASCSTWNAATFGTDPAGTNSQSEKTGAFYTQLRFGFDDWRFPVDGNVGIRYVQTDMKARGYTVFNPTGIPNDPSSITQVGPAIPIIAAQSAPRDYDNSYHNVLPSLNLRMKATDKLQFRMGAAMGISRPDFSQLQGYTTLSETVDSSLNAAGTVRTVNNVALTGSSEGNPNLRPVKSSQVDLTGEWYFAPAGSLTVAVFNKRLKDIIITQSYGYALQGQDGKRYDFNVTAPVNGARGHARGVEIAYQQYFDKLPGWMSGIGLQANYTYVDSAQKLYNPVFSAYCSGSDGGTGNLNLNLNGCDVDGRTFGNLPLQNLSKNSYNLALLYDKGPLSARLAWSWRSKYLQAVNVNGTRGTDGTDTNPNSPTVGQRNIAWALPTWADDFGQLDASLFYNFTETLSLGVEAQNLTDAKYKQLMTQGIGDKGRAWFVSGRRYTASLRYAF